MKTTLITGIALIVTAMATAINLSAADGKEIYTKECAKCHGATGKGDTKMGKKSGARDYTDPKVQAAMTDAEAIKAVKDGLKDKAGKTLMKPSEGLSDADIKAVVAHMRTFAKK
jgi:cytochrome c6